MGMDESKLGKGQAQKLNVIGKSTDNTPGEEMFSKWPAWQKAGSTLPKPDAVAVNIADTLPGSAKCPVFSLENYRRRLAPPTGRDDRDSR